MGRPEQHPYEQRVRTDASTDGIILVERRDFVRGCLNCWLAQHCGYRPIAAVSDIESVPAARPPSRWLAAVFGISGRDQYTWLRLQVSKLRFTYPDLPILVIVASGQVSEIEEAASQLDLNGYIPECTSPEVAAAAIHLVAAGGRYFPRGSLFIGRNRSQANPGRIANLTSRQRLVLVLLGNGMSNKMIAQQLGMSLSTVKVHVHHIIRKLKVGNRTGDALLAQHLGIETGFPPTGPGPQDVC